MKNLYTKYIVLTLLFSSLMCFTFWIRIQGVERLPEGQFTENDAYLFHRQASIIAEQGHLSAKDMHRWLPLGRDNKLLLSLYPYAIAYIHKILPWLSLYRIQLYLPVISFTIGLGVLFLFLTRCYGIFFAILVGLLLVTLPGSISRSAAGFGDRDAWCWMLGVLAVTSYLWKEHMDPGRRRWVATALAGFTVFLGGMSWEGFGLFTLIILTVELWKFCTPDAEAARKEYLLYILMFVPLLYLISPAYHSGYGFSTHVAALMLLPALTVFVIRGLKDIILQYIEYLRTHARKLAWALTSVAITTGACYIIFYGNTWKTTAFVFGESRFMQNIGELGDPYFEYWIGRYGAVFLLGSLGLILACLYLWKRNGILLAISLTLFTATTFFRWPVSTWIGGTRCDTFFLISLGMTAVCLAITSLRKTPQRNELVTLAVLAWFILWVSLARGGKRYDFFIGFPLAYGTAWLLYLSPAHFIQKLKEQKILYQHRIQEKRFAAIFAIVVLVPIFFWNPIGGHANRSVDAAARMKSPKPGTGSLAQTFEWMKDTLSEDAVIAANWSHGTQLNVLGGVKTIVDSDHFLPHWIHLYYRHLFCAQDKYEALTFLKTHNTTHLLLTKHEVITRSHAYSLIGSNTNDDRHFRLYELRRVEIPIGAPHQLRPHRHETPVAFVDMISTTPIRNPGEHTYTLPDAQQKVSVTIHLRTHHNIFKEILVSTNKPTLQAVDIGNGGIIFNFDAQARLQNAHYIPPLGWKSVAVKLFLRNKYEDVFIPIYPANAEDPALVKVWKIHYPSFIKADPRYLITEPTQYLQTQDVHDSDHPHED